MYVPGISLTEWYPWNVNEGNPRKHKVRIFGSGKEKDGNMSELLERILCDENMKLAQKRVYANKGVGGVDGVTVQELDEYMPFPQ